MTIQKKTELTENGIDEHDAITIMRNLFSAINHCHAMSIIHRDIKADNIMINDDGEVRLIDFGMAKCFEQK